MKGKNEGPKYPEPWAQTPVTSHLASPQEMAKLLSEAGFEVTETEDRTAPGIAAFRERLATPGGPPTLGTHLLMGANVREKSQNLLAAPLTPFRCRRANDATPLISAIVAQTAPLPRRPDTGKARARGI